MINVKRGLVVHQPPESNRINSLDICLNLKIPISTSPISNNNRMAPYVMHASSHSEPEDDWVDKTNVHAQGQDGDENEIGGNALAGELEPERQQMAAGAEEEGRQNVNRFLSTPMKEDKGRNPFVFGQQPGSNPFGPNPFGNTGQNPTPKRWSQLKRHFSAKSLEGAEERYRNKHKDYKFWEGVECAAKEIRVDMLCDEIERDIQEYARTKAVGELDEDMDKQNAELLVEVVPQPKLIEFPVISAEEKKQQFVRKQIEQLSSEQIASSSPSSEKIISDPKTRTDQESLPTTTSPTTSSPSSLPSTSVPSASMTISTGYMSASSSSTATRVSSFGRSTTTMRATRIGAWKLHGSRRMYRHCGFGYSRSWRWRTSEYKYVGLVGERGSVVFVVDWGFKLSRSRRRLWR